MRRSLIFLVAALLLSAPAPADEQRLRAHPPPSFVARKSEQVREAFFLFRALPPAEQQQDALGRVRERDELLLPAGRAPSLSSGALGAALLGAGIVFAAHAPARLRALVSGPLHVGPALLDGGGLGVAVGGKF